MPNKLPLSEVVASVTDELLKAESAAKSRGSSVMQFDECELEFAVEVEKEGKAGINVWVIELGGGKTRTESNVVRIKFKSLESRPLQVPQALNESQGPAIKRQTSSKK
jgi:hypothetical protein